MAIEELVGIFNNDNFEQLFVNAKPLQASIKEDSTVMTHPLEDGSKVADHQVFNLVQIDIPVILSSNDFVSVYQSINKAFKDNTLFTVQTKVNTYKNMIIQSMPREETVNSGIPINLSLVEFKVAQTITTIAPKYPKDTNTIKRGVQNSNSTNTQVSEDKKTSILAGIIS